MKNWTNSNININEKGATDILEALQNDTEDIRDGFSRISDIMKYINGDYETWKGLSQEKFYENYKTISDKFDGIVINLERYNSFLQTSIDNYKNKENVLNNNVEVDKDNLDIN